VFETPGSSLLCVAAVVFSLGCADSASPVSQSPPPPQPATEGFIWGQVLEASGMCIRGGEVEIVAGPGIRRKSGQHEVCGAWDYVGYEFGDLPVGATVTLRAGAPGYRSEERELVVRNGGEPVQFVLTSP
jgi:hypothetical protein